MVQELNEETCGNSRLKRNYKVVEAIENSARSLVLGICFEGFDEGVFYFILRVYY